jgi:hypothetical protein
MSGKNRQNISKESLKIETETSQLSTQYPTNVLNGRMEFSQVSTLPLC